MSQFERGVAFPRVYAAEMEGKKKLAPQTRLRAVPRERSVASLNVTSFAECTGSLSAWAEV